MEAAQLRSIFLDYFADNGHTVVPSASLIPHDPSLLFTVAGMVPFKPYFTGEEPAPYPRAVSVQKCFRALDIDIIGTTQRHLTFFEMMGNFSFGDYFKEGAIKYAWGLITEGFGLDPERLWVTVHTSDDQAEALWRDLIGVPASRIQRLGADNFWEMGRRDRADRVRRSSSTRVRPSAPTAGPRVAARTASSSSGTSSSRSTTDRPTAP